MYRLFTRMVGLLGGVALLASCATTSLVDSWRNPNVSGQRLHKLLVAGIVNNGGGSRVYEDILVNEFQQRGVEAVPAYSVMSDEKKADRQILAQAVKQGGAEAVLTVQTVKMEKQPYVQPGYATSYPGSLYPPTYPSWDYGYYGSTTTYYEPPYVSSYEVATIEVKLLDGEGRLLWAATVRSSEPGNAVVVGKDLARIIMRSLAKDGFL